jgi:hypothetical protein
MAGQRFNSGQVSDWGRDNQFGQSIPLPANGIRFIPGLVRTTWTEPVLTLANGTTYYIPAVVREPVTFDAFAPFVNTGVASSEIRMAVCTANQLFQPIGLVVESGVIATTSGGEKVTTVTKTTLIPGRYLLSVRGNASVGLRGSNCLSSNFSLGTSGADNMFFVPSHLNVSEAYGAYSSTPTAWTVYSNRAGGVALGWQVPVILRSAAP